MSDLVSQLLGKKEVIPIDARRVSKTDDVKPLEDFLPTALALVAPDCTPQAETPLSPAQVPKSDLPPAQDPVKPVPLSQPKGEPAVQALLGQLPGIPSPSEFAAESAGGMGGGDLRVGVPLPEHKPRDIAPTMDVFRRFVRI